MSFLGFLGKKKSFLGVDIGSSSIKIVELAAQGGKSARLVTYGRAEYSGDLTKVDVDREIARIVATIKAICKAAHTTTIQAVAALPTFAVFSSVITLPNMSNKELSTAIRWEARKFVPLPLEEMSLDWKVLAAPGAGTPAAKEKSAKEKQNLRVLLTAAPQNVVKKYLAIFKQAGLELLSLETEAFALERSLVASAPGSLMVVDLGSLTTDICIVENGIPVLNRSVDVGGMTISKAIAYSLNVDIKRAEQFKRDIGLSMSSASGGIPKTIETTISPIINEIKYNLSLYQSQSATSLEKIVLTGGSSFLPHLPEYLANLFQTKVYIGDPWARVSVPVDLKPVLSDIGPQFSSAIGLALREIV